MRTIAILVVSFVAMAASECSNEDETDRAQREQTATLVAEAHAQVGMPGINNFNEKRLVRMLYELRDQEGLTTYTYIVDMQGQLHLFCQSVGYGIPYAVQFSNPERPADWRERPNMPQPEPNGLFMPDALSATWVMCAHADGPRPVYVEPTIIVSPMRLTSQ